jgi:hypothetical protein
MALINYRKECNHPLERFESTPSLFPNILFYDCPLCGFRITGTDTFDQMKKYFETTKE